MKYHHHYKSIKKGRFIIHSNWLEDGFHIRLGGTRLSGFQSQEEAVNFLEFTSA